MDANGSLITKKVIAYAFKDLLKTKKFQKIYIKEIMTHAEYRRQTFYDHFSDKYELLLWIYDQELTEMIDDFIHYEDWRKIASRLFSYFHRNKNFYQKTLIIPENNLFDMACSRHMMLFFNSIFQETTSKKEASENSLTDKKTLYAYGMTAIIREWLFEDCCTPVPEMENYFVGVIENAL